MTELQRTPLAACHEALGARMVDFHGWWMPVQYEGIVAEHQHTRTVASAFDVSHMGQFMFTGEGVAQDLGRVVTCDVAGLRVGRCRYGLLLNEGGGIEDDLLVYRVAEDEYWLIVNASTREKDAQLVRERIPATASFEDASERLAMIAIQGPKSRDALRDVVEADLDRLRYYRCIRSTAFGREMLLSRTGYTGELGYELCFDANDAGVVWDEVLSLPDVKPAGLGARDTLRLESGMCLYGQDLTPDQTPVEAGLMGVVDLSKDFVGKEAVAARMADGPRESLIAFEMPGRQAARHGHEITLDSKPVGHVTSGSFAPSLGHAVGMGYVAPHATEPGNALAVNVRSKALEARVVTPPFYNDGSARV